MRLEPCLRLTLLLIENGFATSLGKGIQKKKTLHPLCSFLTAPAGSAGLDFTTSGSWGAEKLKVQGQALVGAEDRGRAAGLCRSQWAAGDGAKSPF